MPDERWTAGEDVGELAFPEGNRPVHGRSIEADGRELAAGDRSLEIGAGLVLQGVHVGVQDLIRSHEKTGLAEAQAVGEEWDSQAHTPRISAVEGREVARHWDCHAPDIDSRWRLRTN